ncbi:MAG: hypothetical protein EOO62_10275 [Hymenobacter sp.]|nr:MAG: hypothetical protein EOO62_10275 [Hymenobacter sp.]
MGFPQAKDSLAIQKGMCLLFASVFIAISVTKLLLPDNYPTSADEQVVSPPDGFSSHWVWGSTLLIGLAMLALFFWLHRRVRRVIASDSGLQIMVEPTKVVTWSEVKAVSSALPNLLTGFYSVKLIDGTQFYVPIERVPPTFSALKTWYASPTAFEQLCNKHGVWIG